MLWPAGEAPYAKAAEDLEHVDPDCWGGVPCARQVTTPTLTLYAADPPSRQWLLIAPGGGYESVAIEHEGAAIAQAFAARGISAAVLKYRIPDPRTATHPERVPLADLHRAMALLRAQQRAAGMAGQIGIVGFSAGGHLAAYAMVHPQPEAALNPDFALLIYGVSEFTAANEEWLQE
ncbi:MAG: alpha/beta hydrolase fold domain-containing protein, partial [Xanthomonadales bacterium]|nr:alpha/beta hydrolase fold domain-containing protein [Xanthomonadales bacterium]